MAANGGPIESISIKGRRFAVDSESEMELVLGGFTNETKLNGDGSFRISKARRLANAKGGNLVVDNDRGDFEFITECANEISPFSVDITLCDGNVFSGNMVIIGEFSYKTKDSLCEVELSGTLEKQ